MLLIPNLLILKSIFPFLAFLIIWEITRKWIALYKSAQQKETWRFICILIFNTCGILPIIYLLIDSTKKDISKYNENSTINSEKTQNKKTLKEDIKKLENTKPEKKQKWTKKETWKKVTKSPTKKK